MLDLSFHRPLVAELCSDYRWFGHLMLSRFESVAVVVDDRSLITFYILILKFFMININF